MNLKRLLSYLTPIVVLTLFTQANWAQINRTGQGDTTSESENNQTEEGSENKKELTEEEKLTQIIEDAKMLAAKRNTALVGANATLQGIRMPLRGNYMAVASKIKSGEIANLGTYPNPRRVNETTVTWKKPEETAPTTPTTPTPATPATPAN